MCITLIVVILLCIGSKNTEELFYFDMDVCSENGTNHHLTVDVKLIDNGIDPIHYRGKIFFDEVEYIDHITRLYSVKMSVFERIKERWRGISYHDFFSPRSGRFEDRIEMTFLYDNQGQMYVRLHHTNYCDSSFVDYFGPARDKETADSIKEKFYMYELTG